MGKTRGFSKMLICVFSFCFEANKTNKIIGNRRKFLLNSLPCSDMILKWWDISSKDKLELEEGPFLLIEGFKKPSGPPQSSMEPWICKMISWKPINPVLEYEYGPSSSQQHLFTKGYWNWQQKHEKLQESLGNPGKIPSPPKKERYFQPQRLHPGRLTWNLQINHLEGKWSSNLQDYVPC